MHTPVCGSGSTRQPSATARHRCRELANATPGAACSQQTLVEEGRVTGVRDTAHQGEPAPAPTPANGPWALLGHGTWVCCGMEHVGPGRSFTAGSVTAGGAATSQTLTSQYTQPQALLAMAPSDKALGRCQFWAGSVMTTTNSSEGAVNPPIGPLAPANVTTSHSACEQGV